MSLKYKSLLCFLSNPVKIDHKLFYKFKIPIQILTNKCLLYHTFRSQTPGSKKNSVDSPDVTCGKNCANTSLANTDHKLKSSKYLITCLSIGLITIVSYSAIKNKFQEKNPQHAGVENGVDIPFWQKIANEMNKFILYFQNPSYEKLLPDTSETSQQPSYTLVIELAHVLIYPEWTFSTGWRFKKRPGLDHLLENLAGMFEIVIFTTSHKSIVYPLVEALDTRKFISHKLGRDATQFVNGHHVKNLEKLNRNLNRVIVVDWNDESVKFHTDNLLRIRKWHGNDDKILFDLTSFLFTIAQYEIEDVREVLKYYSTFDDPLSEFRKKQMEYYESVDHNF